MESARTCFLTHMFSVMFTSTITTDDQGATLVQLFEELSILVEQDKRNFHSSNINILEDFVRKSNDSFNFVNTFHSRCEEPVTIPNSLAKNIKKLREELHFIYICILELMNHDISKELYLRSVFFCLRSCCLVLRNVKSIVYSSSN